MVARDKDGSLWLYEEKPYRNLELEVWTNKDGYVLRIDPEDLSEIEWEDDEPTEVKLTKINE